MTFTLSYFNGNVGDTEVYETKEKAIGAAESYWNHLTPKERAAHGSVHGGWCMVYEGDDESALVWYKDPDTEGRPGATDRIIVSLGDNVVALVVPEIEDDDIWRAIEGFDEEHGTDLWETLNEDDVLGVDLPEYRNAPELDGVCETIYRGAPARRIVEEARNTEPLDSDGQDDEEWFAVQKGVTSDGWPFTARYAFPLGHEPEDDRDILDHIRDVTVIGPAERRPREVTADMKVTVTGHSLVLKITEQARMLGIDRGDIVNVTIRRKD